MTKSYEKILTFLHKEDKEAITLMCGDMGVGFSDVISPCCGDNDYWISGNHDNHDACLGIKGYLGDYGVIDVGVKAFFIRGAYSTDRYHRTENIDWWRCEQLSQEKCNEAIELYAKEKPDLVISHDCPKQVHHLVCAFGREGSRTGETLTKLFEIHSPKFWIFGHHHNHSQHVVNGTTFTCLGELKWKKIC